MAADLSGSSFFRHLQCKDLHQYLGSLPSGILDRLYNHPAICLAVFRELPELAKQFVMRTLFAEQPVPETLVAAWVKTDHQKHYIGSVNRLKALRIWRESSGGVPNRLEMNAIFRSNLKIALCGGGNPWIGSGDQPERDKHARDIPFLDKYSMERWEAVLHFMTGCTATEESAAVSQDVVKVLVLSGLMKCETPGSRPVISPAGFQFLLMDTASQIWYFMLQYLETVEGRGMDLVECLSFLFQISFASLGKDYSTDGMSESQFKFLQHLREFGLVFQRKDVYNLSKLAAKSSQFVTECTLLNTVLQSDRKSRRYYPTRLAINLASAEIGSTAITNTDQKGFIVVETNYRLYAYTGSSLQVALVGLFSEILCRFPNLCVAVLTRDSVQQALASGISAEQILHFLRTRAHPEMLQKTPIIPPTISDQIRLWELERSRMKFTEGVLYNQFLSQSDFETLRKYAEDLGVLMWANSSKRVIVVSRSGHDDVKRFWKRQKQNT